jgi:predicted nucleic acid-binding protein
MIVFDSSVLVLLLDPDASAPKDKKTGQPVTRAKERIEFLINQLTKNKTQIVIPTPVISELLIRAGSAGPKYLYELNSTACFKIADFDQRAAIEAAAAHREAIVSGDKREGTGAIWAKVKFDRQIVAIAKVAGASVIYSDDEDIQKLGRRSAISVIGIADLPLPDENSQQSTDSKNTGK